MLQALDVARNLGWTPAIEAGLRRCHSTPYRSISWITFDGRDQGNKQADAQFFAQLGVDGVYQEVRLAIETREPLRVFRRNVAEHGDWLLDALPASGAFTLVLTLASRSNLSGWANQEVVRAARVLPAGSALLGSDELMGDVHLTFEERKETVLIII